MSASENQTLSIEQVLQPSALVEFSAAEAVEQNELVRVERSAFEAMPRAFSRRNGFGLKTWFERPTRSIDEP